MTGSRRDGLDPTRKLPAVSPGTDPYGQPTDRFNTGHSHQSHRHRWIWPLIGAAAILVTCGVIALVITDSSEQQTLVAPPLPPVPDTTDTTATGTAVPPAPAAGPQAMVPPTVETTDEAQPGDTETVRYSVSGTGRAMSITYVDNGNVLQTEFNVPLPWTKEVQLNRPAKRSASVSIVNAGRPVACAISVDGSQIQQRDGMGLTICRSFKRGHGFGQGP